MSKVYHFTSMEHGSAFIRATDAYQANLPPEELQFLYVPKNDYDRLEEAYRKLQTANGRYAGMVANIAAAIRNVNEN